MYASLNLLGFWDDMNFQLINLQLLSNYVVCKGIFLENSVGNTAYQQN